MKKTHQLLIGMLLFTLLNSSCAVMFTGSKQKITFKSNVNGKVYQNLTAIGNTNEVIKVKRRDLIKLYTVKADGCVDKSMELPIKGNPAFLLDLPFALTGYGLLWSYWDVLHGANMKTPKVITIDLDCKK